MDNIKFCVIGPTASGKDSIVNGLNNNNVNAPNNLKQVVSFTTRDKRDNETDGVEHYFVSDKTYDNIKRHNSIIAETKIGKYRYMATLRELLTSDIYIIDPNGFFNLREYIYDYNTHLKDNDYYNNRIKLVSIYIHTPFDIREKRASIRSDFKDKFMDRVKSEEDQFKFFLNNRKFDYIIFNDTNINYSIHYMEEIMKYELGRI